MALIENLVSYHASRLCIPPEVAITHALTFARVVGQIENSGNLQGSNKSSSAKGLYQFIDSSVPIAKKRLARVLGVLPWFTEDNPNRMTWEQQTLLFLGNILGMSGTDAVMGRLLKDLDKDSIVYAYMHYHSTALSDGPTIARARKITEEYL